jgi:aspartyl-tRNA(Asn)/glutamyl-tRNA(Gln) amidotransferase subunit B
MTAGLIQSVQEKRGPIAAQKLARFIQLVTEGRITAASGRAVLAKMFETGRDADAIIAEEGLTQITDTGAIEKIAREIVAKNPDNVAKYRAGNEGVFKFFVGQVMRETRGQASPQLVNEIVKKMLAG